LVSGTGFLVTTGCSDAPADNNNGQFPPGMAGSTGTTAGNPGTAGGASAAGSGTGGAGVSGGSTGGNPTTGGQSTGGAGAGGGGGGGGAAFLWQAAKPNRSAADSASDAFRFIMIVLCIPP